MVCRQPPPCDRAARPMAATASPQVGRQMLNTRSCCACPTACQGRRTHATLQACSLHACLPRQSLLDSRGNPLPYPPTCSAAAARSIVPHLFGKERHQGNGAAMRLQRHHAGGAAVRGAVHRSSHPHPGVAGALISLPLLTHCTTSVLLNPYTWSALLFSVCTQVVRAALAERAAGQGVGAVRGVRQAAEGQLAAVTRS